MMDCMRDSFNDGQILDDRFQALSPLNHGSFGMVFMARDMSTQDLVAIKCLTKRSAVNDSSRVFAVDDKSEELECHGLLGTHRNIVNLIHHFETDAHMYLVLEFCSRGDLYEAIRTGSGPLETEHVRDFMLQLVDAVSYIHSKGIYHRDIKPENIFLTKDGTLKLGDFGLATKDTWSHEMAVGSDRYMAPEQQDSEGVGYSTAKADIWAIGICLLNILFSRNPFTKPTEADPLFMDYSKSTHSLFDVFPNMSQDTFEIVLQCMSLNPSKRSLEGARSAILRATSFTTFDDLDDDFCSASDVKPMCATLNREPLRTPSVSIPVGTENGAFPWAKALHASPPPVLRQLSVIRDNEDYDEDLFPSSEDSKKDWFSIGNQTPSVASMFNNSLSESMKSMAIRRPAKKSSRSTLSPISGSLPVTGTKPQNIPSLASMFSKHDTVSKSWGDMWDEEMEEELEDDEQEEDTRAKNVKSRQALNSRTWSHDSESDNHSTPRQVLQSRRPTDINIEAAMAATERLSFERSDDEAVEEEDMFVFDTTPARKSHSPHRYSPPTKRSPVDKWSALGERRRGMSVSSERPVLDDWRNGRKSEHHHAIAPSSSSLAATASTYASGLGVSFGKDRNAYGSPLKNSSQLSSSFGLAGQSKGKEVPRACPWTGAKAKGYASSPRKCGLGDLEWVGAWSDRRNLQL